MSALIIDNVDPLIKERLEQVGMKVDLRPGVSREELVKIIKDYSVLIFRGRLKIDREVVDAGINLKILARYGVGLDNVDVDYAIKRGIAVVSAPPAERKRRRYYTRGADTRDLQVAKRRKDGPT